MVVWKFKLVKRKVNSNDSNLYLFPFLLSDPPPPFFVPLAFRSMLKLLLNKQKKIVLNKRFPAVFTGDSNRFSLLYKHGFSVRLCSLKKKKVFSATVVHRPSSQVWEIETG